VRITLSTAARPPVEVPRTLRSRDRVIRDSRGEGFPLEEARVEMRSAAGVYTPISSRRIGGWHVWKEHAYCRASAQWCTGWDLGTDPLRSGRGKLRGAGDRREPRVRSYEIFSPSGESPGMQHQEVTEGLERVVALFTRKASSDCFGV
jgi:hypothetical protein